MNGTLVHTELHQRSVHGCYRTGEAAATVGRTAGVVEAL